MHIDDIKALAHRAHEDAEERERLFGTMLSAKGREAYVAAWALTHLPVTDNKHIAAHREELVRLAVSTPEVPLRRLSMALLERLEWGVDDAARRALRREGAVHEAGLLSVSPLSRALRRTKAGTAAAGTL